MSVWIPIETGVGEKFIVDVLLLGRYPKSDETVAIQGRYETGGYTEGWVDYRQNEFYATHWCYMPSMP